VKSLVHLVLSACVYLLALLAPASAYMSPDQLGDLFARTPLPQRKALVTSLRNQGQIPDHAYQTLLRVVQQEEQWLAQQSPRRESDLLSAAASVAPDPSKGADKRTRRAARQLARTPLGDWGTAIDQYEQDHTIGPLVARGWRIVFLSHYGTEKQRLDSTLLSEASALRKRATELQRDLDAEVARARSQPNSDLDRAERALGLLALLRLSRSEPPPQISNPRRLQSLTITPVGEGGSFYASDPSTPNSIRYYQKIGNTYYYSQ
jgi:hypothetical protein